MAKRILKVAMAAVAILILLGGQQPADAWGNEGHTWINQVAVTKLPKSVPAFLRKAGDRLGYLGPEPDRWRNPAEPFVKKSQEADHYIDLERIPRDFGELPVGRYAFMQRLYEKRAAALAAGVPAQEADNLLPDRVGLQPYIAMEIYDRLKVAFREYRRIKAEGKNAKGVEQNIVFYAGWLGHYVADGSQPLHTTVNYDGWTGPNPNGYATQHGIHWDFESRFIKDNAAPKDFAALVKEPEQLAAPFKDYVSYLRESQSQVEKLYQLEKAGAFKGKGTPEGREFARQRLAAGAGMLASLWYTAWMESAVTPPDPFAPKPGNK